VECELTHLYVGGSGALKTVLNLKILMQSSNSVEEQLKQFNSRRSTIIWQM